LALLEKDDLNIWSSYGNKTAVSNLIFVCLDIPFKVWKKCPKFIKEPIRLDLSVNLGIYITTGPFSAMIIL